MKIRFQSLRIVLLSFFALSVVSMPPKKGKRSARNLGGKQTPAAANWNRFVYPPQDSINTGSSTLPEMAADPLLPENSLNDNPNRLGKNPVSISNPNTASSPNSLNTELASGSNPLINNAPPSGSNPLINNAPPSSPNSFLGTTSTNRDSITPSRPPPPPPPPPPPSPPTIPPSKPPRQPSAKFSSMPSTSTAVPASQGGKPAFSYSGRTRLPRGRVALLRLRDEDDDGNPEVRKNARPSRSRDEEPEEVEEISGSDNRGQAETEEIPGAHQSAGDMAELGGETCNLRVTPGHTEAELEASEKSGVALMKTLLQKSDGSARKLREADAKKFQGVEVLEVSCPEQHDNYQNAERSRKGKGIVNKNDNGKEIVHVDDDDDDVQLVVEKAEATILKQKEEDAARKQAEEDADYTVSMMKDFINELQEAAELVEEKTQNFRSPFLNLQTVDDYTDYIVLGRESLKFCKSLLGCSDGIREEMEYIINRTNDLQIIHLKHKLKRSHDYMSRQKDAIAYYLGELKARVMAYTVRANDVTAGATSTAGASASVSVSVSGSGSGSDVGGVKISSSDGLNSTEPPSNKTTPVTTERRRLKFVYRRSQNQE